MALIYFIIPLRKKNELAPTSEFLGTIGQLSCSSRRRWRSWPEGYEELAESPVGYGITDFAAGAFNDPAERDRLRGQIEQTIRRFEPRLAQVHVVLLDGDNTLDPTLRLRIEALLRVDPAPEPITFDTLVDPATAEVQVKPNTADRPPPDV